MFDLKGRRVFVAGHRGMVGSALVRRLGREDCEVLVASHREVDLTRQSETEQFMGDRKPDVVVMDLRMPDCSGAMWG